MVPPIGRLFNDFLRNPLMFDPMENNIELQRKRSLYLKKIPKRRLLQGWQAMLVSNLLQYNYGTKRHLNRDFLPSDLPSSLGTFQGVMNDLLIQDVMTSEGLDNSENYF